MRCTPAWIVAGALGQAACTLLFPFEEGGSAGKGPCVPALRTVTAREVVGLEPLAAPPPGEQVTEQSTGVTIVRIDGTGMRSFPYDQARPQRSALSLGNEWLLLFRLQASDPPVVPVLYRFDPETLEAHEERDLPEGSPCYATDAVWSHVEPGVLLCHFQDRLDRYDVATDHVQTIATDVPDALGRNLYSALTSDDDEVVAFTGDGGVAFVVDAEPAPRSWTWAGGDVGDVLPTPDGRSVVVSGPGGLHDWDFREGGEPVVWTPNTISYPAVSDDFVIGQDNEGGGALVRIEIGGDGQRQVLAELLGSDRLLPSNLPWGSSLVHHDDRWALATVLAESDESGPLPWAGLVLAIGTDPDQPFASPLLHHRGAATHATASYDGRFAVFTSGWAGSVDVYVAALPRICD